MAVGISNRVQTYRNAHDWSQDELAQRTGLSRAAVSAIETDRVVPSTAAALALAAAFGCRVEDLFRLGKVARPGGPEWAWDPGGEPRPFWQARVGDVVRWYPVERTSVGMLPPDGLLRAGACEWRTPADAEHTLVLAGCDPGVGLLVAELGRTAAIRVLPFIRSSRQALELLRSGVVHVAGVHLQDHETPGGNEQAVRELLGPGYVLLRLSRWQEGLALAHGIRVKSVREVLRANLRWVGREPGSGARRCLDWIWRDQHPLPKGYHHLASDHTGVVETIRTGWAQAGVCVHLAAAEAGLNFVPVREEDYDLCYRQDLEGDPRLQVLLRVVRSQALRRAVGDLPGYDPSEMGTTVQVVG